MANINLLPWREELREKRKRDYLWLLRLVFIGTALCVYLFLLFIEAMTNKQQSRNAFLQTEITQLDKQITDIKNIKLRRKDIERRTDIILNLQEARNLPTHVLDELVSVVPSGMHLSSINKKGNMLWIDGHSESNNNVANMMRKVETATWLDDPNMASIIVQKESSNLLQKFNLNITIKPHVPHNMKLASTKRSAP